MHNKLWTRNFAVTAVSSPCAFWCMRDHSVSLKFGGISAKLGALAEIICSEMHWLLFITNSLLTVVSALECRWILKWLVSGSNSAHVQPCWVQQSSRNTWRLLSLTALQDWRFLGKISLLDVFSRCAGPLWDLNLHSAQGHLASIIDCSPLQPQPMCLTGFPNKMQRYPYLQL